MFGTARAIYRGTQKKHDQLFNAYVMRPIAAVLVAVMAKLPVTPNQLTLVSLFFFVAGAAVFVAAPTYAGGLAAVAVLETSYCFDCADGMLARHKKIASKEGHLFDFFTDELKAVLFIGSVALRLYRTGGLDFMLHERAAGSTLFLIAGIAGVAISGSATSLTNFLRRPEISGQAQTVEAYYETVHDKKPASLVGRAAQQLKTFLRFLNHYPSHVYLFALANRLDVLFWIYASINLLYLAQGWLGIVLRFGRPPRA